VPVLTDSSWPINFEDGGNEGSIDTLKVDILRVKGRAKIIKILSD
jgi:hypothetical protein